MTRLMLLAPVGPRLLEDRMAEAFARQVPITSSYESFSERPRNVGGRFEGSVSEYVSTTIEFDTLRKTRYIYMSAILPLQGRDRLQA